MQINNLTQEQVEMLDFMWYELDTEEDYLNWYECLDSEQQAMADNLQRLVIIESIDEEMANMTRFPDAEKIIQKLVDNLSK